MVKRAELLSALTADGGAFPLQLDERFGEPRLRVYATGPKTLRDLLIGSRENGDQDFLVFKDERLTYEEHFRYVACLSRWLVGHNVKKGHRVGICMRNYPEWSIAFFACQSIGAIAVTLNAWWTARELVYGITDSDCSAVIVDDERYASLQPSMAELASNLTVLVCRDDARRFDVNQWEDVFDDIDDDELPNVSIGPEDHATIVYTSGTTGVPKGALHSQRNHTSNVLNGLVARAAAAAESEETGTQEGLASRPAALQTFPFFHIGGLSGLYINMAIGGKLALMYKWDVAEAIELIRREQLRSWSGVPTLVRQLVEHPAAREALSSMTNISSGGAPVPPDLVDQVSSRFQEKNAPGKAYGSTETTSAIISNSGADCRARPASIGRPMVTVDVRIVDGDGKDCETGTVGELFVRGPNVFVGYWNRPSDTEDAFENGWFKTGDLGYVDDEGFYYIVDRKKDVIIRGGENVYCAEVEGVIHEHPGIADVALIGVPDRKYGEKVMAIVQPKPGISLTAEDVQSHVAERLAHFNVPSSVIFIDEPLPRSTVGKVLKQELRSRFASTPGNEVVVDPQESGANNG